MPFKITCSNGHGMMIREENAGRRVRCPTCGVTLIATAPGGSPTPEDSRRGMADHHAPVLKSPRLEVSPRSVDNPPRVEDAPRGVKAQNRPEVMEALLDENQEPVPAHRPSASKRKGRQRRQVYKTRALAWVSVGLFMQIIRISLLVLAFTLGIFGFYLPVLAGPLLIVVAIGLNLAGIATTAFCIGGSRETGGTGHVVGSLLCDVLAIPALTIAAGMGFPGTGACISALLCVTAWLLFMMYMQLTAGYLREEDIEAHVEWLIRLTVGVIAGYFLLILFFSFLQPRNLIPPNGILQMVLLVPSGLLTLGVVGLSGWYLFLYIRLVVHLRSAIADLGISPADVDQEMPYLDQEAEERRRAAGEVYDGDDEHESRKLPAGAWIGGGIAAAVLVIGGIVGVVWWKWPRDEKPQQPAGAHVPVRRIGDPAVPSPGLPGLIQELETGQSHQRQSACAKLANMEPETQFRDEVVRALKPCLSDSLPFTRVDAMRALARWADKDTAFKELRRFASAESVFERHTAFTLLGELGDERAAADLAARISQLGDRMPAGGALRKLGTKAESEVAKLLTHSDVWTRQEAANILADIGTDKSLPALEEAIRGRDLIVTRAAENARKKIAERHATSNDAPRTPSATADKPGNPPPANYSSGPIAFWSFDSDDGGVTKDGSGNRRDAKLVGLQRIDGVRGKAIEFTGPGTLLDYGDTPAFNFGADAPFSLAFWFRTTDRSGTLLSMRKRDKEGTLIRLTFDPFGLSAEVGGDQDDAALLPARANATIKVNDGQWRHVALVRSGNDIELFVDGEARVKVSNPVAGGAITTDLRHLGADGYHLLHGGEFAYQHFKGALDEFRIYNRELSAKEIQTLATK